MDRQNELNPVKDILFDLRMSNKILIAVLYGSYAKGNPHARSDIDLALYLNAENENNKMEIIDTILMATNMDVSILRLDDEDESPFIVQEALKGIHLVEPDKNILYEVSNRVLHECENIRFRRGLNVG